VEQDDFSFRHRFPLDKQGEAGDEKPITANADAETGDSKPTLRTYLTRLWLHMRGLAGLDHLRDLIWGYRRTQPN
jgi:hypothetical protein